MLNLRYSALFVLVVLIVALVLQPAYGYKTTEQIMNELYGSGKLLTVEQIMNAVHDAGWKPENLLRVAENGGDYADIASAALAAESGDVILAYPGSYTGNVVLPAGVDLYAIGTVEVVGDLIATTASVVSGDVRVTGSGQEIVKGRPPANVIEVYAGDDIQAAVTLASSKYQATNLRQTVLVYPGVNRAYTPATGVDVVFIPDAPFGSNSGKQPVTEPAGEVWSVPYTGALCAVHCDDGYSGWLMPNRGWGNRPGSATYHSGASLASVLGIPLSHLIPYRFYSGAGDYDPQTDGWGVISKSGLMKLVWSYGSEVVAHTSGAAVSNPITQSQAEYEVVTCKYLIEGVTDSVFTSPDQTLGFICRGFGYPGDPGGWENSLVAARNTHFCDTDIFKMIRSRYQWCNGWGHSDPRLGNPDRYKKYSVNIDDLPNNREQMDMMVHARSMPGARWQVMSHNPLAMTSQWIGVCFNALPDVGDKLYCRSWRMSNGSVLEKMLEFWDNPSDGDHCQRGANTTECANNFALWAQAYFSGGHGGNVSIGNTACIKVKCDVDGVTPLYTMDVSPHDMGIGKVNVSPAVKMDFLTGQLPSPGQTITFYVQPGVLTKPYIKTVTFVSSNPGGDNVLIAATHNETAQNLKLWADANLTGVTAYREALKGEMWFACSGSSRYVECTTTIPASALYLKNGIKGNFNTQQKLRMLFYSLAALRDSTTSDRHVEPVTMSMVSFASQPAPTYTGGVIDKHPVGLMYENFELFSAGSTDGLQTPFWRTDGAGSIVEGAGPDSSKCIRLADISTLILELPLPQNRSFELLMDGKLPLANRDDVKVSIFGRTQKDQNSIGWTLVNAEQYRIDPKDATGASLDNSWGKVRYQIFMPIQASHLLLYINVSGGATLDIDNITVMPK